MRIPLATLLALLLSAAPASAQATATATPDTAGKGARIHIELDASQPPVSGRLPTSTTLSVQAGFRFDGKAVAKRCTPAQAQGDTCPARSKAGTATATAAFAGTAYPVDLRLYLAKPQQPGDLAGVAAVATVLGAPRSALGRLVRTTAAPFGLQVILPTPGELAGFPLTLTHFSADIGARRTVKLTRGRGSRRRTRRVRHFLLSNPRICAGTWAAAADLAFADATTATLDAPIACSP